MTSSMTSDWSPSFFSFFRRWLTVKMLFYCWPGFPFVLASPSLRLSYSARNIPSIEARAHHALLRDRPLSSALRSFFSMLYWFATFSSKLFRSFPFSSMLRCSALLCSSLLCHVRLCSYMYLMMCHGLLCSILIISCLMLSFVLFCVWCSVQLCSFLCLIFVSISSFIFQFCHVMSFCALFCSKLLF